MALLEGAFTPEALHTAWYVLAKVAIGAVLAGVVGWEREVHGRPAGMRTHILLVIGVVLMCEVSRVFGGGDDARIAAQIVTGVGFLGAGAIMRMGLEIKGLTSAASLWAVTSIGMAVSVGGAFLLVAVGVTAMAIFTLEVLSWFEKRMAAKSKPYRMDVVVSDRHRLEVIVDGLEEAGFDVKGVEIAQDGPPVQAFLLVSGNQEAALRKVLATEGVQKALLGGP